MKNLTTLATPRQVHDFMGGMWRSQIFRRSYLDRGFVFDQVDRFAYMPRFFAEASNNHLERAHFSSWWGVTMIRDDYVNPIIHDLYYLHEMYHQANMPYIAGIGREAFDEKMERNELEASTLSEIGVYFEMPGLREQSFEHEIYADRFINDSEMQRLWKANRRVAIETLRTIRRNIMVSKNEDHMDRAEVWIRRFANQNAVYFSTWADRFAEIEARMARLQRIAALEGPEKAAASHRAWLEAEAALDTVDNIPFREEAELFAPFYWSTKAKYDRAMAE